METSTFPPDQPERPATLKVFCILTFIGVGLLLLFSLMDVNKAFLMSEDKKATARDKAIEQLIKMNPDADEVVAMEILLEAEKYEKPNWIIGVSCGFLSLAGALLMWRLKKTGFYLYVAGELLTYILTLALFGSEGFDAGMRVASMWGGIAETIGLVTFAAITICDVLFIAVYAMNLKHMK